MNAVLHNRAGLSANPPPKGDQESRVARLESVVLARVKAASREVLKPVHKPLNKPGPKRLEPKRKGLERTPYKDPRLVPEKSLAEKVREAEKKLLKQVTEGKPHE